MSRGVYRYFVFRAKNSNLSYQGRPVSLLEKSLHLVLGGWNYRNDIFCIHRVALLKPHIIEYGQLGRRGVFASPASYIFTPEEIKALSLQGNSQPFLLPSGTGL